MKHAHFRISKIVTTLLGALIVVLIVTLIAFGLSYLSPSDAAVHSFTSMGIAPTEAQLAEKRAEMGLDQPFIVQYGTWIMQVLQGDFGSSLRTGKPVADMLFSALPYTLLLSVVSLLITLIISLPLGIASAYKRDSVLDRFVQAITYFFNSMPSFFVALLLLYIFSVRLKLIGVLSTRDFSGVFLPALAIALPLSAWFTRQVRVYALEQLQQEYINGLRSRGISEWRILSVHVLHNLAVPLLTLIGVSFGMLLGGSAIVESIFNWPGLGLESIEAVGHRDYPFIGAYALIMAVLYLVINGIIEVSYRLVDPRIKNSSEAIAASLAVRDSFEGVTESQEGDGTHA